MKESQIQSQIVKYLRAVLLPNYIVAACPNGSQRTPGGYPANAVAGLYPGFPDLMILGGGGRIWLLEVKARKGRLSDKQSDFGDWCVQRGFVPWACVHGVDEVKNTLREWQIPTREAAL